LFKASSLDSVEGYL